MMISQESRDPVKCLLAITRQQWGLQPTSAAAIYPWPKSRKLMRSRVARHPPGSDGLRTAAATHAEGQRTRLSAD